MELPNREERYLVVRGHSVLRAMRQSKLLITGFTIAAGIECRVQSICHFPQMMLLFALSKAVLGCRPEPVHHDDFKTSGTALHSQKRSEPPALGSSSSNTHLIPPEDARPACIDENLKYDETQALQQFLKTEEVDRFRKAIGWTGKKINTLPVQTPCCPDDCWWGFQVGSVHEAQFVTEFKVHVHAVSGAIQIYDEALGHYVDREVWRQQRSTK